MKKLHFWFLTLCVFLIIAGVNGWSTWLRITVVANALVVLLDVIKNFTMLVGESNE